jgi:hypothetical protein
MIKFNHVLIWFGLVWFDSFCFCFCLQW